MSQHKFFSDRAEFRRPPGGGLLREEIPERVRNAMGNWLGGLDRRRSAELWLVTVEMLDWDPALVDFRVDEGYEWNCRQTLSDALRETPRTDWLDLMEAMVEALQGPMNDADSAAELRDRLNDAFVRHHSVYAMQLDGHIVELGASVEEAATAEAHAILRDPKFNGPDRQFREAVLAYRRRPQPNFESAASNAANALEGVARIILSDRNILLDAALKRVADEKGLHGALRESLSKVFAYTSDASGRHGLVGDPKTDEAIAGLVLHQCAAAIVFLCRLYGYSVATPGP